MAKDKFDDTKDTDNTSSEGVDLVSCNACDGTGLNVEDRTKTCDVCAGSGQVEPSDASGDIEK